MTVRRMGTWKDSLRRFTDASVAAGLPGGASLFPILARVDGYLFPHEAVFLYWLARSGPGEGAIVEIGSFRGRSALCMAAGVQGRRVTPIISVDPHVYKTEADLRENLEHFGMGEIVRLIVAPSVTAARTWTGPVRVVFVDGHHEKASVEADVDAWLPFLEPGGFLVLHDSTELSSFAGPAEVANARIRVRSAGYNDSVDDGMRGAFCTGARRPQSPGRGGEAGRAERSRPDRTGGAVDGARDPL